MAQRLVAEGLVRPEAVRDSLRLLDELTAGHDGPPPDLGEILVQQGFLTRDKLRAIAPPQRELPRAFGKYLRLVLLGTGAAGEVWKAYDWHLRRWVALKILKHRDPEEIARFRREAQAAARLDHPSIATVFESGEVDETPYIAMRLVRGKELLSIPRDDLRLPVRLVRDAALALHFAHGKGIVHRDIKPTNLLVEDGDPPRIVVTDFGLAKRTDVASSLTVSGNIMGTPAYMAPEQALGRVGEVSARSDVYSLGATLFDLATGRPPFESKDLYDLLGKLLEKEPPAPRSLNPRIDADLETILLKCLEKEPRRRYATAEKLAEDLTRWLEGEPVVARPPSTARRWARKISKRPRLIGAIVALALLVATAAVVIPKWREEVTLRRKREQELVETKKRDEAAVKARERALFHLESGRRRLEETHQRLTDPALTPKELEAAVQGSLAELRTAVALYPQLPEAYLAMARAYSMVRNFSSALEHLNQSIRLAPRLATAYLDRARIRAEILEEIAHDPANSREGPSEGPLLRRQIEEDLARVKALSVDSKETLYARALLAFATLDYAGSADLLRTYLKSSSSDWRARFYLGHALYHVNRLTDAESELTRAIAGNLHDWTLYKMRGLVRQVLKRFDEAIEDCTRSIEIFSDPPYAYEIRGECYLELGKGEEALQDAEAALARYPSYAKAYDLRAHVRAWKKDWKGAVEDETQAMMLVPGHPNLYEMYAHRARYQVMLDELELAIADYTKSLELKPDFAHAAYGRGLIHARMKRWPEAIRDFSRVLELEPDAGDARAGRARARFLSGDRRGAADDARRALAGTLPESERETMKRLLVELGEPP